MQPYEDAFNQSQKLLDRTSWQMGLYVNNAVTVAIDHAFNGRKATSQYMEKPMLEQYFEDINLTQEERDNRELQKMLAYERQRQAIDKAKGLKPPI